MQSVRRICLSFRVCLFWFFAFAFGTSIFATYFVTTKPKIPVRSTPPATAHLPPPPDTPKKKVLAFANRGGSYTGRNYCLRFNVIILIKKPMHYEYFIHK